MVRNRFNTGLPDSLFSITGAFDFLFSVFSVSALKIKEALKQTFTSPADLQRIDYRGVGGSTDGCRGSVQLVVEKIVAMMPLQFKIRFSCSVVRPAHA
jgi:hypothetical protein